MKHSFLDFMGEKSQLDEAFNSAPYELTFGKKNAGDIFFTFVDEDEKEYRIQFYTPQGLGKNVRQVFIGQKRGSVYPDAITRFKNPMRVIASMIEATKQYLATPLGKSIDGYAVNFSKKALERGLTLIPKIIRQSGLKQKLNVMDLTFAPVPDRGYVWLIKKGMDPAKVFDGPKMQGVTWDDPDKVGDVPPNQPEQSVSSPASIKNGIAQHMTSKDMDNHPFRRKVLSMIDSAVQKEGIATPGSPKGFYKFTNGGTFRVYFDRVQNDTFFGSLATDAGLVEIKSPFNADYAAGDFLSAIRKAAAARREKIGDAPPAQGVVPVVNKGFVPPSASANRNPTKDLKQPTNGKFTNVDENSFTVEWNLRFPTKSPYGGCRMETVFDLDRDEQIVTVSQNCVNSRGSVVNSPTKYNLKLDVSTLNSSIKETSERRQNASAVLSELESTTYNPEGLFMSSMVVDKFGTIKLQDNDIGLSRNRQIATNLLARAAEKPAVKPQVVNKYVEPYVEMIKRLVNIDIGPYLRATRKKGMVMFDSSELNQNQLNQIERLGRETGKWSLQSNGGMGHALFITADINKPTPTSKSGGDLKTYAESIRTGAPQTRDIDWSVYVSQDGKTLTVDWVLTFRRNTQTGAFMEYKSQVNTANNFISSLESDSKRRGYKPKNIRLMTKERAESSDRMSEMNGEDAYSEYEQAIGGSIEITL